MTECVGSGKASPRGIVELDYARDVTKEQRAVGSPGKYWKFLCSLGAPVLLGELNISEPHFLPLWDTLLPVELGTWRISHTSWGAVGLK